MAEAHFLLCTRTRASRMRGPRSPQYTAYKSTLMYIMTLSGSAWKGRNK